MVIQPFATLMTPFSWVTEDRVARFLRESLPPKDPQQETSPSLEDPSVVEKTGLGTLVPSVERTMLLPQICRDISRHIEAWTLNLQRNAQPATRFTSPCPLWQCMSWPTTWIMPAKCVASHSVVHGYFRDTCGVILERSPLDVLTVEKHLLIDPTFELTCKLTLPARTSSVRDATSLLPSNHT
jgi:hypothetical protein